MAKSLQKAGGQWEDTLRAEDRRTERTQLPEAGTALAQHGPSFLERKHGGGPNVKA